jgi:F0F1-type ATP synthase membrane subunit c/vacuolar-type H+-ATPase subunit K
VFVNFTNDANYSIDAQATVYAPPSFSVSPPSSNASLTSHENASLSFLVTPPQISGAEFPIAIGVSYVKNGVHYSTLAVTAVTFAATTPSSKLPQLGGTLLILFLLLAIIIIIALIIVSIIISRRRKKQQVANPEIKNNI